MIRTYFDKSWINAMKDYFETDDLSKIALFINQERNKGKIIYPKKGEETFFKLFRTLPYNNVKVVILGQDPYHTKETDGNPTYDGYSFSNSRSNRMSPSLKNILKEVNKNCPDSATEIDAGRIDPSDLERWVKQGVFLFNTAQSVQKGMPGSHLRQWTYFTKAVLKALDKKDNVVWMLWGRVAQNFKKFITNKTHLILEAGHPSPLNTSVPFTGCEHFLKTNKFLEENNINEIKW